MFWRKVGILGIVIVMVGEVMLGFLVFGFVGFSRFFKSWENWRLVVEVWGGGGWVGFFGVGFVVVVVLVVLVLVEVVVGVGGGVIFGVFWVVGIKRRSWNLKKDKIK